MPRARVGEIELEYETFGSGDPLVLIMGIGAQLLHWPEGLCERLAQEGFQVVRFDNRDSGQSTWLKQLGTPNLRRAIGRRALGLPVDAPYRLEDMADDVAGLIEEIGSGPAHVVGASMGGMVAQTLAIRRPDQVRTLTSIMSNTGQRRYAMGTPRAMGALLGNPPRTREQAVEYSLKFWKTVGSTGFPFDADDVSDRARRAWDRGLNPRGFARQLAAILASGSRLDALRRLRTPTLVIHGAADPLILPAAGRATAKAVPDAELLIVPGMGHDLPEGAWDAMTRSIVRNAARA